MNVNLTLRQKAIATGAIAGIILALFACDTIIWSRKVKRLERQATEVAAKAAASDADARAAMKNADNAAARAGFLEE
ncbi:MAG: hypothetical protein ACR2IH_06380 [Pyrinomonadaceae bacterium]